MADDKVDLDFKAIAGPDAPFAQHDYPVYHFDISDDDVPEMLKDPIGFLTKRGVKQYIDNPPASMSVTMAPLEKKLTENGDASAVVKWCCYDVGEGRTCVRHN
ncbi:hypothetical protein [Smaragdicoccus niigatensis]|uniref:hypothetical protein n=1 Tax=Smaragdicoccus niigatensis TaxID=359359 RepID=UPI00036D8F5C|nr:hypothetical protein [Smaragdicoccus niigatensis]